MELPHMGTHCAESACRQLDFLPFTCDLCKKEFCVDHHKYDKHNCSESYRRDVQVPICPLCDQPVPSKRDQPPDLAVNDHLENNCKSKKKKIYTNRCSFGVCKTKEMVPVSCDSCKQNFCLRHRHTIDHECKGPPPAPSLRERAVAAASSRMGSLTKKSTSNGSVGSRNVGNNRSNGGSSNNRSSINSAATAATAATQGIARYTFIVCNKDSLKLVKICPLLCIHSSHTTSHHVYTDKELPAQRKIPGSVSCELKREAGPRSHGVVRTMKIGVNERESEWVVADTITDQLKNNKYLHQQSIKA
ncbi:unnamed protein product, partial [Meganyctiphanes norvegica]